jgi:hypothetical protein
MKEKVDTKVVAPALKALVEKLIDYAGVFPPASLTRDIAVENFKKYQSGAHSWMLRSLVLNSSELEHIPANFTGSLAVLSDKDEPRAATIESKQIIRSARPVYCELAISELDDIKGAGCFAKIRTGGVKPEAIPSVKAVSQYIIACAEKRLPLKATAGLHHAVRANHPLTYENNAPHAVMHGFLNVFVAAAFAWHGDTDIEPILQETDATAFRFDARAHWKNRSLSAAQVIEARKDFIHSFGSCSFEEPVEDLQNLGLLP